MTSLPQLMELHDQLAADASPVIYAVLRTLRMVADGKEFNEGDFRDWIAAGEKLRTPTPTVEQQMARLPTTPTPHVEQEYVKFPTVPLTTGADDRPTLISRMMEQREGFDPTPYIEVNPQITVTVSPELVQMAVEADEDAQKNGTEHWPTLEQVEVEYARTQTSVRPTLAELTNIHTPKVVDGRTKEGRELRANAARRNRA